MTPSRDRTLGWFATLLLVFDLVSGFGSSRTCLSGDVVSMRYVSGDALVTGTDCIGPSGEAYPTARVADLVASMANVAQVPLRYSRGLFKESLGAPMDPRDLQKILLESQFGAPFERGSQRQRRSVTPIRNLTNREDDDDGRVNVTNTSCTPAAANDASIVPNSLCKSKLSTVAPLFGVSLTSGQNVTIVQKFPDLLQQVVYEVCETTKCDVLHGECVQTYAPFLFLVIPLGPVTLTGQDYVLVENGCTCRPKYSPIQGTSNNLEL